MNGRTFIKTQVMCGLEQANLTVNLSKSDFVKANFVYLGHVVCHEVATSIIVKLKAPFLKNERFNEIPEGGRLLYKLYAQITTL